MLLTLVLAAADTTSGASGGSMDIPSWLSPILSTGVVGVFLVMLVFEVGLVTKKSLERLEATHKAEIDVKDAVIASKDNDIADLKTANAELQRLTSEKMIPALVQATEVSRAYVSELSRRGGLGPPGA